MGTIIKEIVVAEDDRVTSRLVKKALEEHGFRVTTAANGREALSLIRSQPVDLLITDVVMPEMDGVDLYLELKKESFTASLPVIIVTDKQMFQESFTALGVDHFVDKASNISVLIEKINHIANLDKNVKHYRKVLIYGRHQELCQQVASTLQSRQCLTTSVTNPMELFSKSLMMKPHIILLQMEVDGYVVTSDVIKALRCFDFLKDTAIVTYIELTQEDMSQVRYTLDVFEDQIKSCQQAGVSRYLGRFNKANLADSLIEFGVS